ncbi:MAG TPA: EamA family transporter [Saprospiraceae bacterium]|nr:EamA family transporter [Saprospiraceae bacterium]
MMAFVWCVLAATFIGVCFKLFDRWKVNSINAIVINYTTCLILGIIVNDEVYDLNLKNIIFSPWFRFDILLGFLFMIGFNLTSYSVSKIGLTISVMMLKMSIILTVAFTVLVFGEKFGWIEFSGFLLAVLAIIAINQKAKSLNKSISPAHRWLSLGLLLLFAAGIEIVLYYVQKTELVSDHQKLFTTIGFGCAALIGWIIIGISLLAKKTKLNWKDCLAGILLGIPNYFSVYLILVLLQDGWKGSIVYPLLNVCVLLLSTLTAVLLFHEALTTINKLGIVLAILAILIIAFAQNISLWLTSF